ncbi:MAG: hypothetical protein NT007_14995 [Candidatus Kapabacteria bacterium]|nr:hypothetical protein [Candidatus Kapabacteria bacterium]
MEKVFLLLSVIILLSCDNQSANDRPVSATITGFDYTYCGCCLGWIIMVDDIKYKVRQIPQDGNYKIDTASLPLEVLISFNKNTSNCSNIIEITKIRKK